MHAFALDMEQEWDPRKHVEKILGTESEGDFAVACWEAGQVSPCHCHPRATEIYFCLRGGGVMRTPDQTVTITPGAFVVHPPGELHEYENGPERTLLFRIRYGADLGGRILRWRGHPEVAQTPEDAEYFANYSSGPTVGPDDPLA